MLKRFSSLIANEAKVVLKQAFSIEIAALILVIWALAAFADEQRVYGWWRYAVFFPLALGFLYVTAVEKLDRGKRFWKMWGVSALLVLCVSAGYYLLSRLSSAGSQPAS